MKDLTRYEKGLENLKQVDAEAGERVIERLNGPFTDVGNYILEFAFGDIGERGVLTWKQREMITIVSLLSQGGAEAQLKIHINAALNVGLTQEEIADSFIHCIPYVGFPRVLNAVFVAQEVFQERN